MKYFLYGHENYLIKKKYQELCKNYDELSIYQNDYIEKDFSFEQFINNVNTVDLFTNKKIYILNNCNFLKSKDKLKDDDYKLLETYLNKSNDETDVVFILNLKAEEKIDNRKKIYKLLIKTCIVFSYDRVDVNTFKDYYNKFVKEYKLNIDNEAKLELINRLPMDLLNLENEIKKLSLLKHQVRKEDIINLINPIYNEKIFDLVDSLINKNLNKGLEIYYDLMNQDNEPLGIIYQLAAQFRFIYKVKVLLNRGYDSNKIVNELKQNPYYIKNTINKCSKVNTYKILKILNGLSDLDITFKSDINVDKNILLEMFIFKELKK